MMNRSTGRAHDDDADIAQSIGDILTTPIGSRIKRRTYGSLTFEFIDQPGNPANRLRLMNACTMAIIRWEQRVSIKSATITIGIDGKSQVDIEGTRRDGQRSGRRINISVPLQ